MATTPAFLPGKSHGERSLVGIPQREEPGGNPTERGAWWESHGERSLAGYSLGSQRVGHD